MKSLKKYVITLLIGFAAVALILWNRELFSKTEPMAVFHILSDAFFAVGVVITCAGVLVMSSNEGTFDALVYGMRSFRDLFRKQSQKKYETFYDYRAGRQEKRLPFGFLLLCGLLFLTVAVVMYLFYRQYSV